MQEPPIGLTMEARYVRCRDGDTPLVELRTGQEAAIRLKGVDTPERGEPGYKLFTIKLHDKLRRAKRLVVHIDQISDGGDGVVDIIDILRAASFDRLPGMIWADGVDVQEWLIEQGARRAGR